MRQLSISVYFLRAVLRNTVARGVDPLQLLRRNRISPRLLEEDDARISIERFADLQVGAMLAMGDEALGYGKHPLPIGSWSMMCHAVIGCDTLGQALNRYCRFYQLFEFDLHPSLEGTLDGIGLTSPITGSQLNQCRSQTKGFRRIVVVVVVVVALIGCLCCC